MQNPQDLAKSGISSGDSEMQHENTMQEDSTPGQKTIGNLNAEVVASFENNWKH
jgi:hypothetical protein